MYRSTPKQIPDKTVLYIKILYATAFHQIVEIIVPAYLPRSIHSSGTSFVSTLLSICLYHS